MSKEELMNRILLLEPDLTQALLQLISDYETKMIKLEKQDKVLEILKRVIFLTDGFYYIQTKKRLNEEDYKIIKEYLENDKGTNI